MMERPPREFFPPPYDHQFTDEGLVKNIRILLQEPEKPIMFGLGDKTLTGENVLCLQVPVALEKFNGIEVRYIDMINPKSEEKQAFEAIGIDAYPLMVIGQNHVIWHTGEALTQAIDQHIRGK